MSRVKEQYEVYPYPARKPSDEKKRLVQGSPSHPLEMDHYLWNGLRDWSKPLKALIAGGGTGDALIQLATVLHTAGKPYDITYIDLSEASRKIAEERAKIRGLPSIRFITGDLTDAPELGTFDYIDCCGVLHHLPDPLVGFRALSKALNPDGGLGFMVYAPYGRSGVYPLQEAFGKLFADLSPKERLVAAKAAVKRLPSGHPFKRNRVLVDHEASDAGFYDLLLHSQDQAFDVTRLCQTLEDAGLGLSSFVEPARYEPERFIKVSEALSDVEKMAVAEKLDGTMKTHIGYARLLGSPSTPAKPSPKGVPNLKGVPAQALAKMVAAKGQIEIASDGEKNRLTLPKTSASLIAGIDGRRTLAQLQAASGLDPIAFNAAWGPASKVLTGWGLLWYSGLLA